MAGLSSHWPSHRRKQQTPNLQQPPGPGGQETSRLSQKGKENKLGPKSGAGSGSWLLFPEIALKKEKGVCGRILLSRLLSVVTS